MGPLATANHQIREAERSEQERRLARLVEPRRLTDRLLNQLEELNLEDVHLVPHEYEPSLAELRIHLGGWAGVERSLIDRLQSGTRTAELIETIFTIQEVISPPTLPPGTLPLDDVEL